MNHRASENGGPQQLWQNQKTEGVPVSVDQIRASAGRFQRTIHWRNVREYVAALIVLIFFSVETVRDTGMPRGGDLLVIAGTLYVVWHLWSKGSALPAPEDAGLSNWLEFRQRDLRRQRDLLRSVWLWYIGPFIPGLVLLIIGRSLANPALAQHPFLLVALPALPIAALFVGVGWLNRWAARRLQRKIDELDRLIRG